MATTQARQGRRRLRRRGWQPLRFVRLTSWSLRRATVVLIITAGTGVLLYPAAANWFHTREHASVQRAYAQTVQSLPPERIKQAITAAHRYNRHIPSVPVRDPYSSPDSDSTTTAAAERTYDETLNVTGDGVMGLLSLPSIGVSLPIYHGTSEATLGRGVGHLTGTALPVGGPGTHAVLTGHSGIPGDNLFTRLHEARLGEEFTVTVLDTTLTYRIDQILTVLPDRTEALNVTAGKDYLTLVTCMPIGVNSHRLLVRGSRVPTAASTTSTTAIAAGVPGTGFPWWALIGVGSVGLALILSAPTVGERAERRVADRRPR